MSKREWKTTTVLISSALAILKEQQPMTIRRLFYRLVSVGHFENTDSNYKKVSRAMTDARNGGRYPFAWIVDRSRPHYKVDVWRDPKEYGETIKYGYRKDYWDNQPYYCEIWTEKDAIIGSIEQVADELGVGIYVARGYQSTTKLYQAACRIFGEGMKKKAKIFCICLAYRRRGQV